MRDAFGTTSSSYQTLPTHVVADLRTDHAGEVGAVCIYLGILSVSRDPKLRGFAQRHLETERKHLCQVEAWLIPTQYSRFLPLWRLAGFLTGALPALFGSRIVYATIEAVETFVGYHYEEQIQMLRAHPELDQLRKTLGDCRADEVTHLNEAFAAQGAVEPGLLLRLWCSLVGAGSRGAVALCRHI